MPELINLQRFSKETGMPPELFEEIYQLESKFYKDITQEPDFDKRQQLYSFIYQKVAELTSQYDPDYFLKLVEEKTKIAQLFRKELNGKSILDIGSGSGAFLYAIAKMKLPHKLLCGLDVKSPTLPIDEFSEKIMCLQRNAIKFTVPQKFEVAMLDNVYEHIAHQDKNFFLNSITNSLESGGKLILLIPHREFGPTDWTKLIDASFSGKLAAHCIHLDETTFADTVNQLKLHGFVKFSVVNPFKALVKLNDIFPNLRLPIGWFTYIESNKTLLKLMKLFKVNGRSFLRMQVAIIAEKA